PGADRRPPVILGEMPHLFTEALQLVEAGRHVLVAAPQPFSAQQIATLLAARQPRQAVFLWSERRYHPAYRLLTGLAASDEAAWRPRYVRQTYLGRERPSGSLLRWRTMESLAVVLGLCADEPQRLRAAASENPSRGAIDYVSISIEFTDSKGFLEVGLGEAIGRQEATIAAHDRRACIDELNPSVPIRIADDDDFTPRAARSVLCPAPSARELARLQCLAFLEATASLARSQAEAALWLKASACWQAIEASLAARGLPVEVVEPTGALRVLKGRGLTAPAPMPQLRVVG
ncbi:MAG TPA: hypothetical protein VNN10_10890, partial [Dehalococcoidia bacterium]|nr:hypothetical protein [Dehalococcoidia bacterium]